MYEGLKDNTNAEKWSEDKAESILSDILGKIRSKEIQYVSELNIYFNAKNGGGNYICKKLNIINEIKKELKQHSPNRRCLYVNPNRGCPDKVRRTTNNRVKKRLKEDNNYRLKFNLASNFRNHLKNKNGRKTFDILGYTVNELRNHLEVQFDSLMNWDNYGSYWHVDHIKPASLFNHENDNEVMECWSLNNLQPLEARANMSKGNRYGIHRG